MFSVAFWNLNRSPKLELVSSLASETRADVLVFAESLYSSARLAQHLNAAASGPLYFPDFLVPGRLVILHRLPLGSLHPVRDGVGFSIRHVVPPVGPSILLVAVHLSSKLHQESTEQIFVGATLSREIRQAERDIGHSRTIVVGDFNMNPFEPGLAGTGALHAVMDRRIAARGGRVVQGEPYPFFYNPMWSHSGDIGESPAGTYFYNSGSHVCYFWNMFDQFLIRPDLLPMFNEDSVRVITTIGAQSLLGENGRPNAADYSDHLPISLRLAPRAEKSDGI